MSAREITAALKGRWCGSYGMARCPAHEDRTPSLQISDADDIDDDVVVCCHAGCGWRDVKTELRAMGLLPDFETGQPAPRSRRQPRPKDTDPDTDRRSERARDIWRSAGPIEDTFAETYLRERGLRGPFPPTLRFQPACRYAPAGVDLPAMIAAVTIAPSCKVVAIHRTYITHDGRKAPVSSPKMMLGPCARGAVRLAAAGSILALAEGVETALSVQQATGISTWATLSTSGLKAVVLPPDVHEVIICADGDDRGERAAQDAAQRFVRDGLTAKIARAPLGYDFNDVLTWPENVIALDQRKSGHG